MSTEQKGFLGRVFALFSGASDFKVNAEQAQELIKTRAELEIIDVRTPAEYAEGHLPQARLLNFFDPHFKSKIEKLKRETPYFLYCRSGNRSGKVARLMQSLGFKELYDLQGGLGTWQRGGGSIET